MDAIKKKSIEEYWLQRLSNKETMISFPWEGKSNNKTNRKKLNLEIDQKHSFEISEFCNHNDSAIQLLFIGLLKLQLYKYFETVDSLIATSYNKEAIIFLRDEVNEEDSVKDLIISTKKVFLDAIQFSNYSIEELLESLKRRAENMQAILQVACIYGETNIEQETLLNFELVIKIARKKDSFDVCVEYNSNTKYSDDKILLFFNNFKNILANIKQFINCKLSEVDVISYEEKNKILKEFNNTKSDYPREKTIIDLYEKQLSANPDNLALTFQNKKLTYKEFDKKVNQLAAYLLAEGLIKGDVVGLIADRSLEMMISIFAILKAGGVYLPLSPSYPIDRIKYMVENSNVKIILCQNKYSNIYNLNRKTIVLESKEIEMFSRQFEGNNSTPSDLAYIIYTSGSTGKPKGVMIEHHSLVNRICWMGKNYSVDSSDVFIQKTTISFDVSIWELFWWSVEGASLFLLNPDEEKFPDKIIEAIYNNKVSIIHFVPSMLRLFLDELRHEFNVQRLQSLKYVFASGEALINKDVASFNKTLLKENNSFLINLYGPTEATIDVSYFNCYTQESYDLIPIGKPIDNIKLFVIDKNDRIVPIGVPGELCISGVGLARGYINNEKLTKEKFIHLSCVDEKVYKTGDLVSLLPDGNIEFYGRIDNQVKVRGNRIELGEIENYLLKYSGIKEVCVTAKTKDETDVFLCAYYISEKNIEIEELRKYLSQELPDYMIPSFFISIKKFPITSNGKIALKELPDPTFVRNKEYIPPKGEVEILLAKIWGNIIGIEKVGREDNFFNLGGDSIKMVQIASRMFSEGYKLSAQDFYKYPTIESLSAKVSLIKKEPDQSIIVGEIPLTPIQKWFFSSKLNHEGYFNQSVLLSFQERLEENVVKEILKELLKHHDALRIVFNKKDGNVIQHNEGLKDSLSVKVVDYHSNEFDLGNVVDIANDIQSSISISNGPLIKLGLFRSNNKSKLLIVVHHLVIDTVSWRILFEDIDTLFKQYQKGIAYKLPIKSDSFALWGKTLESYSKNINKESYKYWDEISLIQPGQIVKDDNSGTNFIKDIRTEKIILDKRYTKDLLNNVHHAFGTNINEILILSLLRALNRVFSLSMIKLDIENHGRNHIFNDINIDRTLGWFTIIYPFLFEINNTWELSYFITTVKESLRKIPNNGIEWGLYQFLNNDDFKRIEDKYKPQICFNYLGQFDTEIKNHSFDISTDLVGSNIHSDNERNYELDVSGFIAGGQMELNISYSKFQYKKENIEKLLRFYKESLVEVIEYCKQRKETTFTPSDFTYNKLSIGQVNQLQENYEIKDIYSLSPIQEGILFHSIAEEGSAIYNINITYDHIGNFNIGLLEESLNELVNRYDIFRTSFLFKGYNRPLQLVRESGEAVFTYKDLSKISSEEEKIKLLDELKSKDTFRFNLEKDVLLKLQVTKKDINEYEFIWNLHHIVVDGWSCSLLIQEFLDIYNQLNISGEIIQKPITQFSTYIQWLSQIEKKKVKEYWENYLNDYTDVTTLPKYPSNYDGKPSDFSEYKIEVDAFKTTKLKEVSKGLQVTLNTIFETLWAVLLGYYNNSRDVVFGKVIAGRPADIENISEMIGMFINTIPVRITFQKDTLLKELIQKVQELSAESEPNQYFSLADIQSMHLLGNELIDHIIAFENYPVMDKIKQAGGSTDNKLNNQENSIKDFKYYQPTNYYLNIIIIPGDEIKIEFYYNVNQIDKRNVLNVAGHFGYLIDQFVEDENISVSGLKHITTTEKQKILQSFNNTKTDYPKDETIVDLFYNEVKRNPESMALFHEGKEITYQTLNEKSDQLSEALIKCGFEAGDFAGIMVDRSPWMIIGILGILKAGGVYVPIDINYPEKRKLFIISDCNLDFLLTETAYKDWSIAYSGKTLLIDDESLSSNIENKDKPKRKYNIAYVMYTSGSTGNPKGVLVEHKNVVRLVKNSSVIKYSENERFLQTGNPVFDATTFEIWGSLLNGGSLYLVGDEVILNSNLLHEYLKKHKISVLWLTVSLFNQHVDQIPGMFQDLKYLLVGGDALSPKHINKALENNSGVHIINGYGPTENTTFSTTFLINKSYSNSIPIGKPITNSTAYIFSEDKLIQPVGVTGELCVGGDGVSIGYLNSPDLTREKYKQNPCNDEDILYCTGDLARWMADGNIEFLGRKDNQVKLRGFRIELGEIENKLTEYKGINEATVIAQEQNGNKTLVAYCVAENELEANDIKNYLKSKIPSYMVPLHILFLDSMPLTPNGKVDKRKLPIPEVSIEDDFIYPRNRIEEKIVEIWSEVLFIDKNKISVNKNFFDLGGNSISMISVNGKINNFFNRQDSIVDLIKYTTVESISEYIKNGNDATKLEVVEENQQSDFEQIKSRRARRRSQN